MTRELVNEYQNEPQSEQIKLINATLYEQNKISQELFGTTVMGTIKQENCKREFLRNNTECLTEFIDTCRSARLHVLQVNRLGRLT